jgi:hypothetical protein
LPQISKQDEGSYRLRVRWSCDDVYSSIATLTIQPAEPEPELKLDIHHAVEIEFPTVIGQRYQIQVSDGAHNWVDSDAPIAGTGDRVSQLYSTRGNPALLYRVKRVSP